MAKILFISLTDDITCLGVRYLISAVRPPHEAFFLMVQDESWSKGQLKEVLDEVKPDVVGVNTILNVMRKVRKITVEIKGLGYDVVWGGVYSTLCPDDCLKCVDKVLIGECEHVINTFLDNPDSVDCPNLFTKQKRNVVSVPANLDSLAFPDYSFDNEFVIYTGKLRRMSLSLFKELFPKAADLRNISRFAVRVISNRSCPHACNYCGSPRIMRVSNAFLRKRSPENLVAEVKELKRRFGFIEVVTICDDTFLIRTEDEIRDFCGLWKREVGLPFRCAASPLTLSEEKLSLLVGAGLMTVGIGLQTACEKSKKLYNRFVSDEKILECSEIFFKFRKSIRPPVYDVLLDSPFESIDDGLETFRLVLRLHRPCDVALYSLSIFPGSKLAEDFPELIDVSDESLGCIEKNFLNLLFVMFRAGVPTFLLRLLGRPALVKWLNDWSWVFLHRFFGFVILSKQGWANVRIFNFGPIFKFLFKKRVRYNG